MLCSKCKNPIDDSATICEWCGSMIVVPRKDETKSYIVVENKKANNLKRLPSNRCFWLALLYLIITLGFYSLYIIHAFAKETNIACSDEDDDKTQGLLVMFLLSLITLGIYGIVWNCMHIKRRNNYLARHGKPEGLQISTYLLTIFLFGWLTLGIMYIVVVCKDLYLQNAVNRNYNELNNL